MRILIATDVLSEGQNLRVQPSSSIMICRGPSSASFSVLGVSTVSGNVPTTFTATRFCLLKEFEKLIRLRERVRTRLRENAEVVGTDEAFFEDDDMDDQAIIDLYNEKAGILDGDADSEIDLASQAYQIWKNATDADPRLKQIIEKLPQSRFLYACP